MMARQRTRPETSPTASSAAPDDPASRDTHSRRIRGADTVGCMPNPHDNGGLESLHGTILDAWNRQDAEAYAACFDDSALVIGFDGSEMHGREAIAEQLGTIFSDHEVATYVRVVRSVRRLDDCTGLLHAVVGMVPPGEDDVMRDRHAVQVLVGAHQNDQWRAVSFQNTPAQLHGRPEAVDALTEELRSVLPR